MQNPVNLDPNFEVVNIRVNKSGRGSYWYYPLVGQTLEVRKRVNDKGVVSYQYMDPPPEAGQYAFFDNNDIEEVAVS